MPTLAASSPRSTAVYLLPQRRASTDDRPRTSSRSSTPARCAPGCTGSGSATWRAAVDRTRAETPPARARAGRAGGSAEHATPADLGERLLALGLEPDDPPELTGMTCTTAPPPGEPTVEVRRARDARGARSRRSRSTGRSWSVPEEERETPRARRERRGRRSRRDGPSRALRSPTSTASRSASAAAVVHRRRAALLLGGATLPEARGRGVYTLARPRPLGAGRRARHAAPRRQRGPRCRRRSSRARLREPSATIRLYADRL